MVLFAYFVFAVFCFFMFTCIEKLITFLKKCKNGEITKEDLENKRKG